MLSNTCKYAIRASIYLALEGNGEKKIGIKQIGNSLGIPVPFLGKILQLLVRHKLLSSTKGPNGGFGLGRDADKISLFDIVKILDGDGLFSDCLISLRSCQEEHVPCPMHKTYENIREELRVMFEGQSIGDLARNVKKMGGVIYI